METRQKMSMEEVHKTLLNMLLLVDEICRKNKIVYFLSGGSALGAVRERGFIPWDDDVDIMIPREDYEEFLAVMKDQIGGQYYFGCLLDPKWDRMYACMIDTRTEIEKTMRRYIISGVTIDFFPIDGLPESLEKTKKYYMRLKKKYYLYNSAMRVSFRENEKHKRVKKMLAYLTKVIDPHKICLNVDRCASRYRYNECNYVGCAVLEHYMEKEWFKKEWFEKQIYIDFEGRKLPVMNGYDNYLKKLYGDYMIRKSDQDYPEGTSTYYWKKTGE